MMNGLVMVAEALARIVAHRPRQETESLPLVQCIGRVTAADVRARLTHPPLPVSAMDGYAVRLADTGAAGRRLKVIGEAPAGSPLTHALRHGEAVRIFTGGAVPEGADHILIQEEATRSGDEIIVDIAQKVARHIRGKGIDFREGDMLISAGTRLGPAEIAIAAAANHATLTVMRRLKVAVLASGDELCEPGSELTVGQIINSNASALFALVTQWGGEPLLMGIAGDTIEQISEMFDRSGEADIIVPIGGASVGDHDQMRAAFLARGGSLLFSKVAVRPGKPTWSGTLGRQLVLGLPGNPASAYVCAHLFLEPLLDISGGLPASITARLTDDLPPNGNREAYLRAVFGQDGEVRLLPNQDSSLLRPFLEANCLVRRAAGAKAVFAGSEVDIVLLASAAGKPVASPKN